MNVRRIAWLSTFFLAGSLFLSPAAWAQEESAGGTEAEASEEVVVETEAEAEAPLTLEDVKMMVDENIFAINSVWVLLCGVLVLLMQCGFGLLEGGFLQQKHVVNVLIKNAMDYGLGAIVFFLFGFSIMYSGAANGWLGMNGIGIGGFAPEESYAAAGASYSEYTDFYFQLVFAAATATIMSGAMAGRTAFKGYLVATIFVTGFIYPVSGFWKWGGGWLDAMGFQDYAGSMVVHGCGGFIALAAAITLGPRLGRFVGGQSRPIPGHSLPMAFMGAMILFFTWFGFNAGSELAAVGGFYENSGSAVAISIVCVNTAMSPAAGAVAAVFLTWMMNGRPDLGMALNGILGGLVGITANCNVVAPGEAIVIGLVSGVIVTLATQLLDKVGIDDPVGAFPVHGACGLWGCIACGIFGDLAGLDMSRGSYIVTQIIGSLAIAAWAFIAAMILLNIIKFTIGIRATEKEELEGLDLTEHGSEAYPDYSLRIH
jgi:Amt family ammonium transporter